jgi:phosphatidylinositol glycan class N
MIAGFYEDVSAVTRGWQDNPVEFDHVFNQSRQSWLWGSPDITRMFARRHEHVRDWHYSSAEEDFAARDLTVLDTMVFNRVQAFLQGAKENATLRVELAQDRIVFFLHLLGLDSNGHAHRPFSPEYTQNMALVDRGVAAVAQLFDDYYGDGLTAFVFTSDHGMSAKGAHGDGDPANTRTPLVIWGAGVRGPEPVGEADDPRGGVDTGFSLAQERRFSRDWGLGHLRRLDIEQADLSPLLASLIGVPNPVHSVGRLPSRHLLSSRFATHSLLRNARQRGVTAWSGSRLSAA